MQNDDLVLLTCVDFGHLITKKKPEEDDKIEDLVNPHSVRICEFVRVPLQSCMTGALRTWVKGSNRDVMYMHLSHEIRVDRPASVSRTRLLFIHIQSSIHPLHALLW